MKTIRQNIGIYGVGTEFCVHVDNIGTDGEENVHDVEISVEVPDGVQFSKSNLQQGSYDPVTSKWNVGTIIKGTSIVGTLCFEVTDDTKGPFTFTFNISTNTQCQGCTPDSQFCVIAEGIACTEVAKCANGGYYSTAEQETGRIDIHGDPIFSRTWEFTGTITTPQPLTGLIPDTTKRILDVRGSYKIGDDYGFGPFSVKQNAAGTATPFDVETTPAQADDIIVTVYYTKLAP